MEFLSKAAEGTAILCGVATFTAVIGFCAAASWHTGKVFGAWLFGPTTATSTYTIKHEEKT